MIEQKNLFPVEVVNAREVIASEIWRKELLTFYQQAIRESIESREAIINARHQGSEILRMVESFQVEDNESKIQLYNLLNHAAQIQIEVENEIKEGKLFLDRLHKDVSKFENEIKGDLISAEEIGKVKISNWETKEKQRIDRINASNIAAAKATQKQEQKQLEEQAEKAETAEEKAALLKEAKLVQVPLVELENQNIKTEKVIEVKSKSKLLAILALRVCFSLSEQEKSDLLNYLDEKEIKNLLLSFAILQELRIPSEFPPIPLDCITVNEVKLKKYLEALEPGFYIYGQKVDESNPDDSKEREKEIERQVNESWLYVEEKAKNVRLKRKS